MSAPNSYQKSTGEGGEPNEHKEPDETTQEVSWYDIPGVPQEPHQNGKTETEVPIQEVSWYGHPGYLKMKFLLIPLIHIMPKISLKCITWKNEEQICRLIQLNQNSVI